jgi:hypothetical protein
LLAVGGVATVLVAAFPLPADDSSTSYHAIPATISFVALSLWPSAAYSSRARVTVLGLRASTAATLAMLALLVTFAIQRNGGGHVGLTERVLAGAQALWPATVVLTLLSAGRRTSRSRYLQ